MSDRIPLKLLFQQKTGSEETRWRLTVAIEVDVVHDMLKFMKDSPSAPAVASATMPSECMEVHVEFFSKDQPFSGLLYYKNLNDHAWTTNHITLLKGGTPVG